MAGYRPKSLDELNSLYGKSINAKNEIEKKAMVLEEEKPLPVEYPVYEEAEAAQEPVTEEITGLVDDFIKSFAEPSSVTSVRPATVAPTTVRAVSSAKSYEGAIRKETEEPVGTAAPNTEKPRLIRNTERNDLFEDYKKVMDDEDEEEFSRHRRGRSRVKKLFEKKSISAEAETVVKADVQESDNSIEAVLPAENEQETPVYDIIVDESAAEENEIPETLENIEAVIEKVLGRPAEESQQELPAEEPLPAEEEPFTEEPQILTEEAAEQDALSLLREIYTQEETFPAVGQEMQEAEETDCEQTDDEAVEADEEAELQQEAEDEADEAYLQQAEQAEEEEPSFVPAYVEPQQLQDETVIEAPSSEKSFEIPARKGSGVKNLLLVIVFVLLLLATAVSGIKAFVGINSDTLFLDKYHIFSADADYEQAGVKKGDLVVVTHEAVREGDIFAYKKGNGEYGLARLDGILNEESVVADNDGQKSIVFKNTLRGVLDRSYPAIGSFAALISSHYLYIVGSLLILSVALGLVVVFLSKRKGRSEELLPDALEQESYTEDSQYAAVEEDFRYLISDEQEDAFEVYREDSQADDEEGLPINEGDAYKYEPDEYVTK